jgi:hypothetical protein
LVTPLKTAMAMSASMPATRIGQRLLASELGYLPA